MKNYIALSLITLTTTSALWVSCGSKSAGTNGITGKIEGAGEKMIYLEKLNPNGKREVIDSAKIDKEGTFALSKKANEHTFYQLRVGAMDANPYAAPTNVMVIISDSTEQVSIEAKMPNLSATYKTTGSTETPLLQEIAAFANRTQMRLDSINQSYQANPGGFDQVQAQNLVGTFLQAQETFMQQFVDSHKDKFVALQAVAMLNPDVDFKRFQEVAASLNKNFPQNPFVQNFVSGVNELTRLAVGNDAPDFSVPAPDGKTISLSSFKGKYVFIDFWASWCRPCRAENPNLVATYNTFKKNNFEIFGVSLDQNRDAWIAAIAEDKLTWPQASDLGYWNSAPAKLYKIEMIPASILVDPDGKIVAKNLRGEALNQKLREIFAQP